VKPKIGRFFGPKIGKIVSIFMTIDVDIATAQVTECKVSPNADLFIHLNSSRYSILNFWLYLTRF